MVSVLSTGDNPSAESTEGSEKTDELKVSDWEVSTDAEIETESLEPVDEEQLEVTYWSDDFSRSLILFVQRLLISEL